MSIGWSIALTILSTSVARIGIVLLKQAIASDVKPGQGSVLAIVRSNRGRIGTGLEVIGYGLFLWALSGAESPISILPRQSILQSGCLVQLCRSWRCT